MKVLDLFGANRLLGGNHRRPSLVRRATCTVWESDAILQATSARRRSRRSRPRTRTCRSSSSPFEAPDLPKNYADFVILNDNYHDTYWQNEKYKIPQMDPNAFLKAVYAAMKPGAVIGVIDHVANPNSDTRATVEKYHRIDPERGEGGFQARGVRVCRQQRHAAQSGRRSQHVEVHDPKIAGKTDRFIFKFKKPR